MNRIRSLATILCFAAAVCLSPPACTTLTDGTREPNDALITSASYTATFAALAVVKPAQRAEMAPYLNALAGSIRSLSGGRVPTSAEITAAIALWKAPDAVIVTAAQALAGLYTSWFPSIRGNAAMALRVLTDIAAGVDNAARAVSGG